MINKNLLESIIKKYNTGSGMYSLLNSYIEDRGFVLSQNILTSARITMDSESEMLNVEFSPMSGFDSPNNYVSNMMGLGAMNTYAAEMEQLREQSCIRFVQNRPILEENMGPLKIRFPKNTGYYVEMTLRSTDKTYTIMECETYNHKNMCTKDYIGISDIIEMLNFGVWNYNSHPCSITIDMKGEISEDYKNTHKPYKIIIYREEKDGFIGFYTDNRYKFLAYLGESRLNELINWKLSNKEYIKVASKTFTINHANIPIFI